MWLKCSGKLWTRFPYTRTRKNAHSKSVGIHLWNVAESMLHWHQKQFSVNVWTGIIITIIVFSLVLVFVYISLCVQSVLACYKALAIGKDLNYHFCSFVLSSHWLCNWRLAVELNTKTNIESESLRVFYRAFFSELFKYIQCVFCNVSISEHPSRISMSKNGSLWITSVKTLGRDWQADHIGRAV